MNDTVYPHPDAMEAAKKELANDLAPAIKAVVAKWESEFFGPMWHLMPKHDE